MVLRFPTGRTQRSECESSERLGLPCHNARNSTGNDQIPSHMIAAFAHTATNRDGSRCVCRASVLPARPETLADDALLEVQQDKRMATEVSKAQMAGKALIAAPSE